MLKNNKLHYYIFLEELNKKTIENKKDNLKKKIFIKKKIVITFLKFILNQKKLLEFIEK